MIFEKPVAEVIKFDLKDVISSSGTEPEMDMAELIPGLENCMG